MFRNTLTAMAAVLGICTASAGQAQEMTLKFSHTFPGSHYLVEHGIQVMLDEIVEKTNGEITFEVYPAGQLGKNNVRNLNSGLADLAYMSPSVESTELALSTGLELPGMYDTACEGSEMAAGLMREGGILDTEELGKKGIHFLYSAAFPQYTIFSASRPLENADSLKGMKIRAGGAAITKSFRELGVVPVQISGSELFDALKRGTVDGAFFPAVAMHSYDLQEVVDYAMTNTGLGAASSIIGVADRVWDQLNDEQKQIFTDAAAHAQSNFCTWLDNATDEALNRMVEEDGVIKVELSEEDRAALQEKLTQVRQDWADELESTGKPGQAVLEAFQSAGATN